MKYIKHYIVKPIVLTAVFLLLFAAVMASVALISLGIFAVPLSLLVMTGLFTAVASDLSPMSVFFAGISCLSGGAALCLAAVILFPLQTQIFKSDFKRNSRDEN